MKNYNELRIDQRLIFRFVGTGNRILDLGCGSGELMKALSVEKGVDCTGIDRDPVMVAECISRQLKVFNLDFNECLESFEENSFDHVLIYNSLQESRFPEKVIKESLRIGRSVILGFPNFGYIRSRAQLFFGGRAPVTVSLPGEWYNTDNLRFLTVNDFVGFTEEKKIQILKRSFSPWNFLTSLKPNLFAEYAIFMIKTADQ
ncbi:MAG: methionine biosynthesis protein MetW [Acidobacteriota bacterium]